MSIDHEQQWITGEEFGRERRRLIEAGVADDAPEFQQLNRRVMERNEALWDRYGKQYLRSHPGKWIAISLDGEVLIRDQAGKVMWDGDGRFGPGNFAVWKLAEFRGHELLF